MNTWTAKALAALSEVVANSANSANSPDARHETDLLALTALMAKGRAPLIMRDGFAWWFRRYSKDATLGALEADARKRGVGLWTDPAPVPPWEFRRQKREGTQ